MTAAIKEAPLTPELAELHGIEDSEERWRYLASHPELVSAELQPLSAKLSARS